MKKVLVGTTHRTYLERRNFLDLPLSKYEFTKVWDVYQLANYAYWKLSGGIDWRLNFTHSDVLVRPFYRSVRLLHFMNSISSGSTRWVSSFETLLPRYRQVEERHVALLAEETCGKLIAVSRCAFDLQVRMLRERFPDYVQPVRAKMVVLHPPQPPLIGSVDERCYLADGRMIAMLAGTELTRKGLLEVLDAVEEVVRRGGRIHLNLVGEVTPLSYPYAVTDEEVRNICARIASRSFISHWRRLPNAQVVELMRETDVGLMPSYHDSHGYSVLEFLASGCPVITTNLRALPEINNDDTGWIVPLPLDDRREVVMKTPSEEYEVRRRLREALIDVLESVLNAPEILRKKGAAGLDFIRKHHDPYHRARYLESVYDGILQC